MGGLLVSTTWLNHWDGMQPHCWRSETQTHLKRNDVQNLLRRMRRQSSPGGYILRGTFGAGKRELIRAAFQDQDIELQPLWVSGSRYGSGLSYGAIHFLLTGVPDGQLESPLAVYGHLKKHFELFSPKPLIIMEHIGLIDSLTTAVLSQLVSNGFISLVVIDDLVNEIPEDLAVLDRAGTIETICLNNLTLAEARNQISVMLDLDVSYLTAFRLWNYTAGSSEVLRAVVRDCQETGLFQALEGSAVLSGPHFPIGVRMEQHVLSRIERLSSLQREILEHVSTSGVLPESATELDPVIDFLYLRELLVRKEDRWIIPNPAISQTIASWHGQQLSEAKASYRESFVYSSLPGELSHEPAEIMMTWLKTRETAHEMMAAGVVEQAISLVQSFLLHAQAGPAEQPSMPYVDAHIVLLELLLSASRLDEAQDIIKDLYPGGGKRIWETLGPCNQHLALALIAQFQARTNDHESALLLVSALLKDIDLEIHDYQSIYRVRSCMASTLKALITACLALGNWDHCRRMTQMILDGALADYRLVTFAETTHAAMLVMDGRTAEARKIGIPLKLQVYQSGTLQEFRLIDAIVSGSAWDGSNTVLSDPQPAKYSSENSPIGLKGCISQFLLARGEPAKVRELTRWAERHGEKLMASLLLAQQICQGNFDLVPRLVALQDGYDHKLANSLRYLAMSVQRSNSQEITAELGRLAKFGYLTFANDVGDGVWALLNAGQKRQVARNANAFLAKAHPETNCMDTYVNLPRLTELTEREKFVAAAAASGLSNMEIAEQASVSVRTIEGHLYQVYSKLGISRRGDLMTMAGVGKK